MNFPQPVVSGSAGKGLVVAGIAAVGGAALWALLTVATNYKIGFAAVGIGLLVGKGVERFGGGSARLPVPAAVIALLGCVLGDLLTDAHFVAQAVGVSIGRVLKQMATDPTLTWNIFTTGFKGFDLVFYAIAAYEGYRFASAGVQRVRAARAAAAARPEQPMEPPAAAQGTT